MQKVRLFRLFYILFGIVKVSTYIWIMLDKINNAITKDELLSLIMMINANITLYDNNELIIFDDAIKRREIILNLILQQRIIELQGIAQNWFDRKEYQVSEVFTELAEDYIKQFNFKL